MRRVVNNEATLTFIIGLLLMAVCWVLLNLNEFARNAYRNRYGKKSSRRSKQRKSQRKTRGNNKFYGVLSSGISNTHVELKNKMYQIFSYLLQNVSHDEQKGFLTLFDKTLFDKTLFDKIRTNPSNINDIIDRYSVSMYDLNLIDFSMFSDMLHFIKTTPDWDLILEKSEIDKSVQLLLKQIVRNH